MRRGAGAGRGGFTLIELMIALVVGAIVLGSIYRVLQNNQRFYRSESQVLDVEQGMRAVAQLLPSELREVDATAGDILAMGPDSVTLRALRNTFFICATPALNPGKIVVRNDLTFGYRAVDPTRDRALVFRDGNPDRAADDSWQDYGITNYQAGVGACTDGSGTGSTLNLSGTFSGMTALDSNFTVGSPVRTYELVTYRLYVDTAGVGWLGVEKYVSGAWTAVQPVAGPLKATGGIALTYYDSSGAVTAVPTSVARVQLTVRGMSEAPIMIPGRAANLQKYQDSITVRVAVRNNS